MPLLEQRDRSKELKIGDKHSYLLSLMKFFLRSIKFLASKIQPIDIEIPNRFCIFLKDTFANNCYNNAIKQITTNFRDLQ